MVEISLALSSGFRVYVVMPVLALEPSGTSQEGRLKP